MKILKRTLYLLLIIVIFLLGYYKFWFLRLPQRNIPHNEHVFVSPANGKIVSVAKWSRNSLVVTKGEDGAINVWTKDVDTAGTMVSIQMNVFNAHYQRAPVSGRVIAENYVKGSFNNAVSMSNEYGIRFENEHNEFLLRSSSGKKYKVIQIAGLLARRIVSYAQPGSEVKQGDVIGLIRLGSQVTVIFPHDVEVAVKNGDIVTDGESVIGIDK
jgi:phosphatidylserine decarboxylase